MKPSISKSAPSQFEKAAFFPNYRYALAGMLCWWFNFGYIILSPSPSPFLEAALLFVGLMGYSVRPIYDGSIPPSVAGRFFKVLHVVSMLANFPVIGLICWQVLHHIFSALS
jgi:hypothetical protein